MLDKRTRNNLREQGRQVARFERFLSKAFKVMSRQSEVGEIIREGYKEEKKKIKE